MKCATVALIALALFGVGLFSYAVSSNQKRAIYVNLRIKYETNFAYRALVSILNLENVYQLLSLSDYYEISSVDKENLTKRVNLTLLRFNCFKISKEENILLEYPISCIGTTGGAVVPIFVPGGKVEKLYFNYERW